MSNDSQQAAYNESFEPRRGRVEIEIGALVQSQDVVYRIIQLIDFNSVIGVNVETGRSVPLRIGELRARSEEHTSELQSRPHLVCRLLLEKKKKNMERTAE